MRNLDDYLRSEYAGLSLDEAVQKSVSALLGVDDEASNALARIGIKTIFDLGSSWLFANATTVITSAEGGDDISRSDLLVPESSSLTPTDLESLPIAQLRGITNDDAEALASALEVTTIRELALWPPHTIARRLVRTAIGASVDDPNEQQAEELRPRLGEYPTERVYYETLVMLGMDGNAGLTPLAGPIPLQPAANQPGGFGQPAIGALVTLSQSWYAKGITLGHMLHSLALAPGEATRIAVVDWSRRTQASTEESIAETERLDNATAHSRAISEVQNAVAKEMQSGGSMTSGWASSTSMGLGAGMSSGGGLAGSFAGIITGALGFGLGVGVSGQTAETETRASSSSWSIGNRSVMAEMTQRVNDRTEQHSTSVRNRRASAVREVAQSEHEQVSTRIVANYNHMHALTVQYYEVVQIYRVVAHVHSAQRVLFLPFELLDFSTAGAAEVVARFRAPLVAGALTPRIRALLLDDRGAVEVRSAIRVRMPVLAADLAVRPAAAMARMIGGGAGRIGPAATVAPSEGAGNAPPILTAPPPPAARVVRPGPVIDVVPGDAELTAVGFDAVDVSRIRIDLAGTPSAGTTFVVSEATGQLDLTTPVRLRQIQGIHVAMSATDSAAGTMTLRYVTSGEQRETVVPLDLVAGTAMQRAAFFAADPANQREELATHLQMNRGHYTRAVLSGLDSASLVMMLSGYSWRGKPLADQVEPKPLAVAGNFLVLRAPVEDDEPAGIGADGLSWGDLLRQRELTSAQKDARLVPIPTGGVFAEAVLGRSNSAEKLDITRFWNWQDSPIPLQPPEIAPVATGSRQSPEDLRPGQLGAPVLNIVSPTALPEPAGLQAVLTALASAQMFRDMSGLGGTQALAGSASSGTLSAATEAGQLASANLKTVTDQAVAMGQTAADMWKVLQQTKGQNGGSRNTVSADGARINHGRDMDARGVSGDGATAPAIEGGSGSAGQGEGTDSADGSSSGGTDYMRESAYADLAAAGVSPTMLGAVREKLGVPITQASFMPLPAAALMRDVMVHNIVQQIKQDIAAVDPTQKLSGVELIDMMKHKQYGSLQMFAAWTNSVTRVYVNPDAISGIAKELDDTYVNLADPFRKAQLVFGVMIVRHELQHIDQFKKTGRPKTYKVMCEYERDTYAADAEWLENHRAQLVTRGLTDDIVTDFKRISSENSTRFAEIAQLADEKKRKEALVQEDFLPPHKKLTDLYKDR